MDRLRRAVVQAGLLFLATVGLLIPSAVASHDSLGAGDLTRTLSLALSVLLLARRTVWYLVFAQYALAELLASTNQRGR